MTAREAPVQDSRPGAIPWDVHERAWDVYAALGHGDQSATRIAERGGFSWSELVRLLAERNPWGPTSWDPLTDAQRRRLERLRAARAEA